MREAVERIRLRSGKIHSAASFQSIYYWQDMQQILTEWSSMQTDTESSDLEAAQRMIASVGEFPFFGILIDLAGKPAAAAGGFPLSEDTLNSMSAT